MKLTRIKNLLPKNGRRDGSVSDSHDPEQHVFTRSVSKKAASHSVATPTRKKTAMTRTPTTATLRSVKSTGAPPAMQASKSSPTPPLLPAPRHNQIPKGRSDSYKSLVDQEVSFEHLSPDERRVVFTNKLRNLGRHYIDDHQQVSVYAETSADDAASPTAAMSHHPHHHKTDATTTTRHGKSSEMPRSRSDGAVEALTPSKKQTAAPSLVSSAFAKLSGLPAFSGTAAVKHKTSPAEDQLKGYKSLESKTTFDSQTEATLDESMGRTVDGTIGRTGPSGEGGRGGYFSPAADTGLYMTDCNQTQYTDGDDQTMTVCTDARTQMTESSQYTNRGWFDFLFSCQVPNTTACGRLDAAASPDDEEVYRVRDGRRWNQRPSAISEEEASKRGEEDEFSRGPMNPCTAPYPSCTKTNHKKGTPGCVAPSDSRLASFLSISEDSEDHQQHVEKRSHHSPRSTRYTANDERQTSFASSSCSSSSGSMSPTESTMSSYQRFQQGSKQPLDGKLHKHARRTQPMVITTTSKKKVPDPYDDYPYEPKHTPLSSPKNKKKTKNRRQFGRDVEFLTSDYAGRKSSIPLNTPIRTEPTGFFKRAAAGLWMRRAKPCKAVAVPSADTGEYTDEQEEEDNSTISTKFSLMTGRN